jgi:hypothetical protein
MYGAVHAPAKLVHPVEQLFNAAAQCADFMFFHLCSGHWHM